MSTPVRRPHRSSAQQPKLTNSCSRMAELSTDERTAHTDRRWRRGGTSSAAIGQRSIRRGSNRRSKPRLMARARCIPGLARHVERLARWLHSSGMCADPPRGMCGVEGPRLRLARLEGLSGSGYYLDDAWQGSAVNGWWYINSQLHVATAEPARPLVCAA
eukprot:scaffold3412_cov124-Isochrysis_galbana.AAC.2